MLEKTLPNILFYPLLLLWSIFYGSIAGAIYKIYAVYENWKAFNHLQLLLWKKYPLRSHRKYITSIWAKQVNGKSVEFAEYTKSQIEKNYPDEPFPIFRMLTNTTFMLFIVPFMAISGLFIGPIYVFKRSLSGRLQQDNLKNDVDMRL